MPKYTELVSSDLSTDCLICRQKLVAVLCQFGNNPPYLQWRTAEELAGVSSSCDHEVA